MALGCFIDANLLVLLVVGTTDRGLIPKHRRLRRFTEDDYDLLVDLIIGDGPALVTPNTLTEASNLLAQHRNPERSRLFDVLRLFIEDTKEVVVASVDAAGNNSFNQLGLTDAALLEVVTTDTPLITVDVKLYLAALAKGPDAAVNFTHLQRL